MNEDLEPVTTSDTAFAAYLRVNGYQFVGMLPDPNDGRRKVYAFIRLDGFDDLFQDFYYGQPQVHPSHYYRFIKEMHAELREYLEKEKAKR
jgi:hypothetical protein